jgi:hypothetical protein
LKKLSSAGRDNIHHGHFFRSAARLSQARLQARRSIEIACCRQFWMPPGLRPLWPWPFGSLGFQCLPALDQAHPKGLVVGIACRSSETAAFIGSSPELI